MLEEEKIFSFVTGNSILTMILETNWMKCLWSRSRIAICFFRQAIISMDSLCRLGHACGTCRTLAMKEGYFRSKPRGTLSWRYLFFPATRVDIQRIRSHHIAWAS